MASTSRQAKEMIPSPEPRLKLLKNKLDGTNWTRWFRLLSKLLEHENMAYLLERPPTQPCIYFCTEWEWNVYLEHCVDSEHYTALILRCLTPEVQVECDEMGIYDMIIHLRRLFTPGTSNSDQESVVGSSGCLLESKNDYGSVSSKLKLRKTGNAWKFQDGLRPRKSMAQKKGCYPSASVLVQLSVSI